MGRKLWIGAALLLLVAPLAVTAGYWFVEDGLSISRRSWIERHVPWPISKYSFGGCRGSGESDAISTLWNLFHSQAQFQAAAFVDENRNGVGEYGTFQELSAACAPRGRDAPLSIPVLSGAFRKVDAGGEVGRSGYRFRIWLVGRDGKPVGETIANVAAGAADADKSETSWRCYAWPARYDSTGLRTFFVDASFGIYSTENARYSGPGTGPAPDAADGRPSPESSTYAGSDGNTWTRVN
jgi:hypothetical protein